MTGRLLFVTLICSVHVINVQAPTKPKLTMSPSEIRETDSVTLNCEAPSSVSVSQCYFYIESGGTVRELPCLNNMTGSELLEMSHQKSPAQVKVNCFYLVPAGKSPHSKFSSIIVETPLPPTITMDPPIITETDSVTLDCQPPSSVSVSQCFFYTASGGTVRELPCLNTMTGTELLKMSHQSSPAQVKVNCYYPVHAGRSPYSKFSSITIQSTNQKEERNTDLVTHIPSNISPVDRGYTSKSQKEERSTNLMTSIPSKMPPVDRRYSDKWIWKLLVFVAGCGAVVGVVLLASVLLRNQQRRQNSIHTRSQAHGNDYIMSMSYLEEMPGDEQPVVTSVPAANCPLGSVMGNWQELHDNNTDTYHLYSTVSEEPTILGLYSTVNKH